MYKIQQNSQGKYVAVGEYTLLLHEQKIEAMVDDRLLQIHDYNLVEPTKAEKLEILTDVINYYHERIGHAVEECPFDL